ncbi:hypothetical protein BH23GEM7_BH23GEM7_18310 [soil metagenome]
MKHRSMIKALLVALPLSTLVVACGPDRDTDTRSALDREAIERDLELALQPDTTIEPELADVPLDQPRVETPAPAPTTPAPAAPAPRRATPQPQRTTPQPQRTTPAPAAEEPARPAGPRTVTMPVASGTTMALRMNQELSTQTARAGQTFTATLAEAIVSADGATIIPAGSTVRGRVTDAQASERAGQEGFIRLAFDNITVDGRSYPINATVVDAPVRRVTRDSKGEQAAKIAGGAAAGAVLGRVIGKDTKSTVAGAAVGAAAGTAVAMGTANVDAVIPQGARVVIRLDSPVQVQRQVS